MNLLFNKKTSIGCITTLILVIILSQSRFFDFFIESHLGRMILIALIICISYTHKILGVLAVLFIIIICNFNHHGFSEGFDSKIQASTTINASVPTKKPKSNSIEGQEGFNMVEREGTILRGKSSNAVPVSKQSRDDGDNVEPANETALKGGLFSSV